ANRSALLQTVQKALDIFDVMEKEKLPACYVFCHPVGPGMHVLSTAINFSDEIKERYEKHKKEIPYLLELKTGRGREELMVIIDDMASTGLTTRTIAKELNIGATTVKRALRREGIFGGLNGKS
ncbi:MAG: hypothetical protein JZU65_16230, partial [Chlorobium sp.]|nr:hypothetical protein [Chlorobium sp.]